MEIIWHGYNCFSMKTKEGTLVVDPYKDTGLKLPNLKANVVVLSNEEEKTNNAEAVAGEPNILTWPGEFEVSEIAITALQLSSSADAKKGMKKSMIYSFDSEGLKVCYISDFSVPVTEELMENIGDVDILIVPVGKGNLEEIHKTIEEIEPRIVIPVGYMSEGLKMEAGDLETFMKKAGAQGAKNMDKFTVSNRNELPQEKTEFIILTPQTA